MTISSLMILGIAAATIVAVVSADEGACVNARLICTQTSEPPTLDANLADWTTGGGTMESEMNTINGVAYELGNMKARCVYDEEHIYFAMEFPGEFRFDTQDNHKCAAIGTMMKVGADATFNGMGGCAEAYAPDACADGIPQSCMPHLVDIGAHWELATTTQGVMYDINLTANTGDDLVANKDDEFAFSPYCRFDDNDEGNKAGNEWAGAWAFSDDDSMYIFEMSRLLRTASSTTDAQLAAGNTYSFGIAFWDPFESAEDGWTDAGHYLTGCGLNWIDLELQSSSSPSSAHDSSLNNYMVTKNAAVAMFVSFSLVMSIMMM